MSGHPVYQSDPDRAPDSDFEPGLPAHAVVGNHGRMLDPRRTPVLVVDVDVPHGFVVLEVTAFEDTGARWAIELERIGDFQFALTSARAQESEVAAMARAVERLDRPLDVPADPRARSVTGDRLRSEQSAARDWLTGTGSFRAGARQRDLATRLTSPLTVRDGDAELTADLAGYLEARGVLDLERAFADAFVSNARAGEMVKGHRIVLAELGLVAYHGTVVRDPATFDPPLDRARRAEHLLARLGFVRAAFELAGIAEVTLYRGLAVEGLLRLHQQRGFVSATFDRAVASSFLEAGTRLGVMYRQRLPVERLFMTFLETEQLNRTYAEAEAVLLAEEDNLAF
jgi:hypothetical protein